jgi:hypothetical protein
VHAQQHRRVVVARLRRRPRHLWGILSLDGASARCGENRKRSRNGG